MISLISLHPLVAVDPGHRVRSPGQVLQLDYLDPLDMSVAQLARRTGIKANSIRRLITSDQRMTAALAMRLAKVLGTSAFYWMALQVRYDLECEHRKLSTALTPVVGIRQAKVLIGQVDAFKHKAE